MNKNQHMNKQPKKQSRTNLIYGVLICAGCAILAMFAATPSARAICGSKVADNNCGNVSTFTCVLDTRNVPCVGPDKTETICNPTYKEYINQNQWKCQPEMVSVQCVESTDNCGYVKEGRCVPSGTMTCALRSSWTIGGAEFLPGYQYTFTIACLKANGGPDPAPVTGGKVVATASDPDCSPTATPEPEPPEE